MTLLDYFCAHKKFLVWNLLSRNLKLKYRRSLLGFGWTLLVPAAMAAVYYFVFKVVLKIQYPNYLVFIFSGTLLWTFYNQSISEAVDVIVSNQALITKVPVTIHLFPFVGTLTNMITLILATPVLLGLLLFSGIYPQTTWILVPVYYGFLFLLTYAFSTLLAIGYVYLRDLKHIVLVGLQIWFYATPVVYMRNLIPEKYSWILALNPMGYLFTGFKEVMIDGVWPAVTEFGICLGWVILVNAAAYVLLTRSKTVAEDL